MKAATARPAAEGVAHPLLVRHSALAPDPDQPRQMGLEHGLDKLVESIRIHGVIQPILVRPHPQRAARAHTPYMIVVGERRWTAAGRAGRSEVPVHLLDQPLTPAELLMLQIEENEGDNRQELTLLDAGRAVARALQLAGCSQAEFARRHGKSTAWVSYRLALARATGPLGEALGENLLRGMLVARTFERLAPEHQQKLLARARKDGTPISLHAAEKLAGRTTTRNRRSAAAEPQLASTASTSSTSYTADAASSGAAAPPDTASPATPQHPPATPPAAADRPQPAPAPAAGGAPSRAPAATLTSSPTAAAPAGRTAPPLRSATAGLLGLGLGSAHPEHPAATLLPAPPDAPARASLSALRATPPQPPGESTPATSANPAVAGVAAVASITAHGAHGANGANATAPAPSAGAPAPLYTLALSLSQLQALARHLGLDPSLAPRDLVDQLLTALCCAPTGDRS